MLYYRRLKLFIIVWQTFFQLANFVGLSTADQNRIKSYVIDQSSEVESLLKVAAFAAAKVTSRGEDELDEENDDQLTGAAISASLNELELAVSPTIKLNDSSAFDSLQFIKHPALLQPCRAGSLSSNSTPICLDKNARCELGACICKPGFFRPPNVSQGASSSHCLSISESLFKCQNDLQCQAFRIDLFCDTKSHDTPFCNCQGNQFYNEQSNTCVPCGFKHQTIGISANSLVREIRMRACNSTATSANIRQQQTNQTFANATLSATATVGKLSELKPNIGTIGISSVPTMLTTISNSHAQLSNTHKHQASLGSISQSLSASQSSADPLRLRTPIEVFVNAIVLFTIFTVAWFVLKRLLFWTCTLKAFQPSVTPSIRTMAFVPSGHPQNSPGASNQLCSSTSYDIAPLSLHSTSLCPGQAAAFPFCSDITIATGSPLTVNATQFGRSWNSLDPSLARLFAVFQQANEFAQAQSINSASNEALRGLSPTLSQQLVGGANPNPAAVVAALSPSTHSSTAATTIAILHAASLATGNADYANALAMFDPPPKYEEVVASAQQQSTQAQLASNNSRLLASDEQNCDENNVADESMRRISISDEAVAAVARNNNQTDVTDLNGTSIRSRLESSSSSQTLINLPTQETQQVNARLANETIGRRESESSTERLTMCKSKKNQSSII